MQVEANRGPIEELDVQALAVAVFKNEKADEGFLKKLDELSGGLVRSALDAEEFAGKEGETAYFHLVGNNKLKARRLLLVGVGEARRLQSAQVSQMAGTAVRSFRSKNVKTIAVLPRASADAANSSNGGGRRITSHYLILINIARLKKRKRRSTVWSSRSKAPKKTLCNKA